MNQIKYLPFQSFFEPDFWCKFVDLKLNVDRLTDSPRKIYGSFSLLANSQFLQFNVSSFNEQYNVKEHDVVCHGWLINKNTIEQFKECDKSLLIEQHGLQLWSLIKDKCLNDPSLLNYFFILSFADLKKYCFYYWCAYPVSRNISITLSTEPENIRNRFDEKQKMLSSPIKLLKKKLTDLVNLYREELDDKQKSFFVVSKDTLGCVRVHCLKNWLQERHDSQSHYFAFADSSDADNLPGWPLRNFIIFLLYHCDQTKGKIVNFIRFKLNRCSNGKITCDKSKILSIQMPNLNGSFDDVLFANATNNWTGWEKNQDKLMPKCANMSSTMNPIKIAESAVDLNLKLMKWRLMPNIDLDCIKRCGCLILGAGTLGCSISRLLMGWGVRKITFIDNGTISFSNPVRQNLYVYEDCLKSNKHKATTAAQRLQEIFPGMDSKGYCMNIPMPGHAVSKSSENDVRQAVESLTELVDSHQAIFLATDSRESRWLPTLLALRKQKILINTALGFDSYLVMRNGVRRQTLTPEVNVDGASVSAHDLGCYFCHDITAPGNSIHDRTLDQQCTVTRPGVSSIAAALAVELFVSLKQHPKEILANASQDSEKSECLPHTIRGYISNMSQISVIMHKYNRCVACSDPIFEHYDRHGFDFLLKVFNSSQHLEDITGLTEMFSETEKLESFTISDSEDSS